MATWREALTLAETRRDEPSARKREEEQRTRRRRGMKGRSGELVRVEIEILSVRGDFTWAVGRGPCSGVGPVLCHTAGID